MKRKFLILVGLIALLVQGCIVKSLHPFYKQSDLVSKPEILDSWVDENGDKWLIKLIEGQTKSYEMHWLKSGEKDVVFLGHIFQLNGELYLDFRPIGDNKAQESFGMLDVHLLPVHSVAKIEFPSNDQVTIKWFNGKWLKNLFEQKRIKISHEVLKEHLAGDDEEEFILTASTDELQKFLLKYGNDKNAFADDNTVWLKLKKQDL